MSFYLPYLDGDKETILKDAEKSLDKLNLDFDTYLLTQILAIILMNKEEVVGKAEQI